LVQQQTCPTCRGDITANEARQKVQDILNARIQEQKQEQEQETKEEEETEGGNQEDQQSSTKLTSADGGETTDMSQIPSDGIKPASNTGVEDDSDKKPAAKESSLKKDKQVSASASSQECSAFPAFYRVIQDTGASVFNDGDFPAENRVVPFGVILLGQEMDYRKHNGGNRMMVKMPDGWVYDDNVERIIAIPFESQ
jgi:hypothetical protein